MSKKSMKKAAARAAAQVANTMAKDQLRMRNEYVSLANERAHVELEIAKFERLASTTDSIDMRKGYRERIKANQDRLEHLNNQLRDMAPMTAMGADRALSTLYGLVSHKERLQREREIALQKAEASPYTDVRVAYQERAKELQAEIEDTLSKARVAQKAAVREVMA